MCAPPTELSFPAIHVPAFDHGLFVWVFCLLSLEAQVLNVHSALGSIPFTYKVIYFPTFSPVAHWFGDPQPFSRFTPTSLQLCLHICGCESFRPLFLSQAFEHGLSKEQSCHTDDTFCASFSLDCAPCSTHSHIPCHP